MLKAKVFLLVILSVFFLSTMVFADELANVEKQLAEVRSLLEQSKKATEPLEENLRLVENKINSAQLQIGAIEIEVEKKKQEIALGEKDLIKQRQIINERARNYYKQSRGYLGNLLAIVLSKNLPQASRLFFYQQQGLQRDKDTIIKIAFFIRTLEEKKANLEEEQTRLAMLKKELDQEKTFFAAEVAKAKDYQSDLEQKIAELTAKQQQILNARSGSFIANIGDSELADDYNASIKGFRESAPSGYFAVFSFGAYTHRKGMSQYGARARASSQDYKSILKTYYGKEVVKKDTGGAIKVAENGEIDFETTYLYGIAEMPSSWPTEALKAQAVAARTYAYRFKTEGKEICITQSCQVFLKSKSDSVPEAWKRAVDDTKGEVLEDVITYYSSTAGGYLTTMGWDTTDGSGGSNFIDKTYEKLGGSPWLYKAWYTEGYSVNSGTCGRSNPWLSSQEMADIVNAALVLRHGSADESGRITPVTTECWGGSPYSIDELRNIASKYGGIGSADSVSVSQGNGLTANVSINGISFSGEEFKRAFNLRAPGFLSIPQYQFWFFNIEKK